jgi:2-polyprenyl-3-methyl-5-hydroxy-6-metoxy-1,4-benzoquinol methylase
MSLETLIAPVDALDSHAASCGLCGGATRPWMTVAGDWRRPAVGGAYGLVWCDLCRFGQLAPRPCPSEIAAAYNCDEYYTHERPRDVGRSSAWLTRLLVSLAWRCDRGVEAEIDAATLERYGIHRPATLCDVGCGNGGLLARLAAAGYDIAGIEPDAGAREVVERAGFRVYAGSAETLPEGLADARFDVVTMGHVLEHCLDPLTAVRNIAGLMAPGGHFLVETPNNACLGAERAGPLWRWLDVPRHVNFFTPESLTAVCEQAGLTVRAVEFTGYTRQFGADWLADERQIETRLDEFDRATKSRGDKIPPAARRSNLAAVGLLAATCLAAPPHRYDSVRVVACKPE